MVQAACHQVTTSQRLRLVFDFILQIGNLLDRETRFGDAIGFKLETLAKLAELKVSPL